MLHHLLSRRQFGRAEYAWEASILVVSAHVRCQVALLIVSALALRAVEDRSLVGVHHLVRLVIRLAGKCLMANVAGKCPLVRSADVTAKLGDLVEGLVALRAPETTTGFLRFLLKSTPEQT